MVMKKIDLKLIIIVGLIITIFCLRFCNVKPDGEIVTIDGKPYEVIKHTVDTLYVPTVQTVYKRGKDIYRDIPIYVELPGRIDTVQVIKDYYSKVIYKDTLKLKDSLGYVSVTDTNVLDCDKLRIAPLLDLQLPLGILAQARLLRLQQIEVPVTPQLLRGQLAVIRLLLGPLVQVRLRHLTQLEVLLLPTLQAGILLGLQLQPGQLTS